MNNAQLYEMSKKQPTNKGTWELILWNDDISTFDYVIDCLVEICGHNEFQAHQCALITHNNKKCSIFTDKHDLCIEVCANLIKHGLKVTMKKSKRNV